jgi:hypothetical protein
MDEAGTHGMHRASDACVQRAGDGADGCRQLGGHSSDDFDGLDQRHPAVDFDAPAGSFGKFPTLG